MKNLDKPLVQLSLNNNDITVSWNTVTDAVKYEVWRQIDSGEFILINETTSSTYIDTGLDDDTSYNYYVIALGEEASYTLSYDERYQSFVSFYDFKSSLYFSKGTRFLSMHPDNNKIYKHFEESEYNKFYDTYYPSEITLQVHVPENDGIFNNIIYRGETYLNGIDQPKITLTHIQGWNEYQTTSLTPLVYGKNISRKFRIWKSNIPRALFNGNPSLNKLRGQWVKILLKFENQNNYKLVLHDTTINYTAYPN